MAQKFTQTPFYRCDEVTGYKVDKIGKNPNFTAKFEEFKDKIEEQNLNSTQGKK